MRVSLMITKTAIATALVVGIGVVFAVRSRPSAGRGKRAKEPEEVRDWKIYAAAGHRLGPAHAPVVITEFCDFQCPFCRRESLILRRIQARHATDVTVVYRHFPLERRHPKAYATSLASECANAQGRFEEFHNVLFQNQRFRGSFDWTQIAQKADVPDTVAFARCVRDRTYAPYVRQDVDAARRLQVVGTPTILVNAWRLHEPATEATLERLIATELRAASRR